VGHVGLRREGALQTLLLTTTGRKSGQPRRTPVLYLEEGDDLVVVASNFGREHHPAWSSNLLAEPRAQVQIRDRERTVVARGATEDEARALWPRLLELYPAWDSYTERTDRDFRVFFLEPAD
jgi:deazaflavin-dependent oxidoreductase (nitroreductase family)